MTQLLFQIFIGSSAFIAKVSDCLPVKAKALRAFETLGTARSRTPKRHGVTSQTGSESLSQDPILVKRPKVEVDWSDDECLRAVCAGSIRRHEAVLTVAWGGCWPAEGLQIDPEHVLCSIHGSYCHQQCSVTATGAAALCVCMCLWVGVFRYVQRSIRVSQEQTFCLIFTKLSTGVLNTNLSSFVQIGAGRRAVLFMWASLALQLRRLPWDRVTFWK